MPWSPEDASRKTHKAKSQVAKRQWAHVANGTRARELARGVPEDQADADAVRSANGVVKKRRRG